MRISITLFIMILFISACDSKPTKSSIENPLAGHAEALEKAKEIENKLLEAQQKTQDAIEKATQ